MNKVLNFNTSNSELTTAEKINNYYRVKGWEFVGILEDVVMGFPVIYRFMESTYLFVADVASINANQFNQALHDASVLSYQTFLPVAVRACLTAMLQIAILSRLQAKKDFVTIKELLELADQFAANKHGIKLEQLSNIAKLGLIYEYLQEKFEGFAGALPLIRKIVNTEI